MIDSRSINHKFLILMSHGNGLTLRPDLAKITFKISIMKTKIFQYPSHLLQRLAQVQPSTPVEQPEDEADVSVIGVGLSSSD